MTLAKKIQEILKDELKPENIKTVIDMAEFLKFKENQNVWIKINEVEDEYISEEEYRRIEEIKLSGEFVVQGDNDNFRLRVSDFKIVFGKNDEELGTLSIKSTN